jgi:hypothetical protein
MTEEQLILLGREAQTVLDSDAFKKAMTVMKTSVLDEWKKCPIRDKEGQTLLLQLAKLTDKFENMFVGMVQTGDYEQRKIDLANLRDEPKARQFMRQVLG